MLTRYIINLHLLFLVLFSQPYISSSVGDEVKFLYKYFSDKTTENVSQDEALELYTEREAHCAALRSKLLIEFGDKSHLFSFPELDRQTYNTVIQILHDDYAARATINTDALLYLWSYLSGIKVVGLKNGSAYYDANFHVKKLSPTNRSPQNLSLVFTPNDIFTKEEGKDDLERLPIDIAAEFRLRSAYFVSDMGRQALVDHVEEPDINWAFLRNELEPLKKFATAGVQGASPAKVLLSRVLRHGSSEKANNPLLSHGIVTLLRNMAIYLSHKQEADSKVIIGSFSIVSTSNLGLQDGIFLEKKEQLADTIDYLIGCKLFIRLFFRNFREYIWLEKKNDRGTRPSTVLKNEVSPNKPSTKGPNCTEFDPHYEFRAISKDVMNTFIEKGYDAFAKQFRRYIRAGGLITGGGNNGNFNAPYNLLPALIEELNDKQLQIRLVSKGELLKALKVAWFEPDGAIDASGKAMTKKFQAMIGDESTYRLPDNFSATSKDDERMHDENLSVAHLILHLTCYPYRYTKTLNLAGNAISDKGALDLASCFNKGMLPLLVILDLSNNRISVLEIDTFASLLLRDCFKYLDISMDNGSGSTDLNLPVKGDELKKFYASVTSQDVTLQISCDNARRDLLRKVIFLSENWMSNPLDEEEGHSTEIVELMKLHNTYYSGRYKLSIT